jgi:hypothetical protein
MRKLLKLFGIGLLSGAAARAGCMMMDALFPRGFGDFLAKLRAKIEDRSEKYKDERGLMDRGY